VRTKPPPKTMRAAVMYDVDDIRVEERPVPTLEPGDLLVRTAASGVCSGDLMPWYVRRKAPFVFGHEPAGTVVAVGDGALFEVGERVFSHHHAPCFDCQFCREREYVQCATWRATGLDPGGMAEYFRVPRANAKDTLRLPRSTAFVDASLVEPLACVVKSLRRAAAQGWSQPGGFGTAGSFRTDALAGKSVYVVGLGVMGLMHVALAKHLGARVFASDFFEARRDRAALLGAEATFGPGGALDGLTAIAGAHAAEIVVCCPGTSAALDHALRAASRAGTVVMFSPLPPDEQFAFDQTAAYFRDLTLVSSYSCGPDDTAEALRLICVDVVSADRLGATDMPFPAVAEAYDAMREARTVKSIVTF
jgi:L-iditol 2-dehydrogenase